MDLTFGVLGPLEIRAAGELVAVKAPKQRALVASLVLRAGRVCSLVELYAAIWGDEPPADPKAAVHNYVRRLRGVLGEEAIETTPGGYRLMIDPQQVDLFRFRALVTEARRQPTEDPAAESETLRQALALWRGAPLADVQSEYLQRYELSGLIEERLAAVEQRIDAVLRSGAHTQVISELRKLTGEYPLHEGFWSQLIVALYRDGRNADALATYHQARTVLAEETGIDPGHELQQLYQRVLDRDPTLAGPGAAARPAPPAPPMAAPGPAVAPSQLPSDVADFVGRRSLVSSVTELLLPGREAASPPIVVLSGMPAVGKTALAVRVAHAIREQFPDGQLFADLRGYGSGPTMKPGELLPRFLRGLGAATDAIPLDLDEQVMLYRSLLADKRVLIVLDNARNPEQVRPLLPATNRCAVLITSRSQMQGLIAMQGGRPFTLEPLSEEAAEELLVQLIGAERVAAEPAAVRRLAMLCGNLPLALRIAGAMVAGRMYEPIADYVAELEGDDRLSVFSLDDDQQSAVRATFEHSYRALSAEQQRWFRLLSLIPGPTFTVPVAAALMNAPERAAAMLGSLAAANLIESGDARFRVHDLLRVYAAQLCESDEPDSEQESAARRVLDFYAYATTTASRSIEPHRPSPTLPQSTTVVPPPQFTDRNQAIAWLDDERDNLHAAIAYAATSGPLSSAWQLGDAMTAPLALTERYTEWIAVTRLGLKAAIRADDEQGEAIMRLSLGHAYITAGRQQLGIDHLERASLLYRKMGDRQYQVVCENALGMAALWLGQLDVAVRCFERIRELNTEPVSTFYEVGAVHGLGIAHRYRGDLARSVQLLTSAVGSEVPVGPEYTSAGIRLELACTYRQQGRSHDALQQLASTKAQFGRIGSRFGEARTAVVIAGAHLDLGEAGEAHRFAQEAVELARMINHRRTEAEALNALGASQRARGEMSAARRSLLQARSLSSEMGYLNGEIEALQQLAAAERELGVLPAARKCVEEALVRIERSGFALHRGTTLRRRAAIELDEGDTEAAARTCEEAIAVHREVGQPLGLAAAETLLRRIRDGAEPS
ncbi:winged helix-turn-helix domain-containing protein [Actinoplanes sp. LDG1-06]|uniref:Winged helix-turn-helix domain-containing protein n=1 Tax=Paractinoplanes ovalisporus TaxID=2810368 RepID=A0ABS2AW79_9ACTN|nr:BTAD domain-containing putative transcriptional regulator [Actinoplanes ovalisporus]MBM2623648.1 winged helix-turn-helix domain-containing protein [Actinoplanes ovalisporus]